MHGPCRGFAVEAVEKLPRKQTRVLTWPLVTVFPWETYTGLLDFAETVRRDNVDLQLRDLMDLQSFIWVLGSDEYD